MLKKARSFREKFKRGAIGRSSLSSSSLKSHLNRSKSPSPLSRENNNLDKTTRRDGERDASPMSHDSRVRNESSGDPPTGPEQNPNVKKVLDGKKKVQQALKFINFAIDRNNMVLLPGSATIALETTFELITVITNILASEEPCSELTYHLSDTHNCLAELMDWADQVMLMTIKTQIDVPKSKGVILAIESSINNLTSFACEKVKLIKPKPVPLNTMTLPSKTRQKKTASNHSDRAKRNSMPDVPLTPREQTILKETSLGAFDNPLVADRIESGYTDSSNNTMTDLSTQKSDSVPPPPKPFLPPGFNLRKHLSRSVSADNNFSSPPLLPPKRGNSLSKSNSIIQSSTESIDGPPSAYITSDSMSAPSRSSCDVNACRLSQGSLEGRLSNSSIISSSSGVSVGQSSTSRASSRPPYLPTSAPLALTEDLSPIQTNNSLDISGLNKTSLPMTTADLSLRIDQLALGFLNGAGDGCKEPDHTPPLPTKRRSRLGSDYDNLYEDEVDNPMVNGSHRPCILVTSNSAVTLREPKPTINKSFSVLPSMPPHPKHKVMGNLPFHNSSSLCSPMSGNFNQFQYDMASSLAFQAPPLPPKRRHVESYMHVFGTENQISEFNSNESQYPQQYYLHMQQRHLLELFQSQSAIITESYSPSQFDYDSCSDHSNLWHSTVSHNSDTVINQLNSSTEEPLIRSEENLSPPSSLSSGDDSDDNSDNILDAYDVRDQLVWEDNSDRQQNTNTKFRDSGSKRSSKITPGLKGGNVDALIVYATFVGKHDLLASGSFVSLADAELGADFMYQEAFLTTYRTFVSPADLIDKLLYRYNRFFHKHDISKKRLARNAFSLLVRVVDELTTSEMSDDISLKLLSLVSKLVREGELALAKTMRKKILEKCDPNQRPVQELQIVAPKSPMKDVSLLDFKSQELAEQMTLLDNDLYQSLELPELLIWSEEQNEERCLNLVQFTEHFNKMSWWCRSTVLKPDDPATREKNLREHLRKHNNFNSLLALLSALDSAPVSRLEWPRQEKECIQEYLSLTNSSSSFKSYRMALADAEPPCIPYIGMILMDMTFIRIGNNQKLTDGNLNFQMRWQLFNVLECLRRFKKPNYQFKKNQKILQFFDDFNNYNSNDDAMWERSKEIKPTNTK